MRMRNTMTKQTRIAIAAVSAILVIGLLALALYFTSLNSKMNNDITLYNARRDELLAQQERLQQEISSLNQTLNQEIATNQKLADDLAAATNQQPTTLTIQKNPPPPQPVMTSPPAQVPLVTRAS